MTTKEDLRKEYETETGKTHGNALFSTTDYACWLEKRIVKNCYIPDAVVPKGALCDVCGSENTIGAHHMGNNCLDCNPL